MRKIPVVIKGRYYESIVQAARRMPRGTYRWRAEEVRIRVHSPDYPEWRKATQEEISENKAIPTLV
jgi:hypothetical protein